MFNPVGIPKNFSKHNNIKGINLQYRIKTENIRTVFFRLLRKLPPVRIPPNQITQIKTDRAFALSVLMAEAVGLGSLCSPCLLRKQIRFMSLLLRFTAQKMDWFESHLNN